MFCWAGHGRAVRCIIVILTAVFGGRPAKAQAGGGRARRVWLTPGEPPKYVSANEAAEFAGSWSGLRNPIVPRPEYPGRRQESQPAFGETPMLGLPLSAECSPQVTNKWSGQIYNAADGNNPMQNISVASRRAEGRRLLSARSAVAKLGGRERALKI